MDNNKKDLNSLENYFQNSITMAANLGALNFVISPINELTQMNNRGFEINDNLNENRETVNKMNELQEDDE